MYRRGPFTSIATAALAVGLTACGAVDSESAARNRATTTRPSAATTSTTSTTAATSTTALPAGASDPPPFRARDLDRCPDDIGDHLEPATLLPTQLPAGLQVTSGRVEDSTAAPGAGSLQASTAHLVETDRDGTLLHVVTLSSDIGPSAIDQPALDVPLLDRVRGRPGVAGTFVNRGEAGHRRAEWSEAGHDWTAVSEADVDHLLDLLGGLRIDGTEVTDPTGRLTPLARFEGDLGDTHIRTLMLTLSRTEPDPLVPAGGLSQVRVSVAARSPYGFWNLTPPPAGFGARRFGEGGAVIVADGSRATATLADGSYAQVDSTVRGMTAEDLVGLISSLRRVSPDDPDVIDLPSGPLTVPSPPACIGEPTSQLGP